MNNSAANRYVKLHQALIEKFNIEALDVICFGLDIQIETLRGYTLGGKAFSLVEHMEQQGRLNELLDACQRLRPSYPWDDFRPFVPPSAFTSVLAELFP